MKLSKLITLTVLSGIVTWFVAWLVVVSMWR